MDQIQETSPPFETVAHHGNHGNGYENTEEEQRLGLFNHRSVADQGEQGNQQQQPANTRFLFELNIDDEETVSPLMESNNKHG